MQSSVLTRFLPDIKVQAAPRRAGGTVGKRILEEIGLDCALATAHATKWDTSPNQRVLYPLISKQRTREARGLFCKS